MIDLEQTINWFEQNGRFPIGQCRMFRENSHSFDKPYVYHTAWAARILAELKPEKHVDISSSMYFVAIVSAFIRMEYYEYHRSDISLDGLHCDIGDLLVLPFPDNSVQSLSCMHVVEHMGLGRYGDEIDPDGDLKAIAELKRVLRGDLLFVVPVGNPQLKFNAHRIYSYSQVMSYFEDLELVEFSLIPDVGEIIANATESTADEQKYGCGCFWFRKEQQ